MISSDSVLKIFLLGKPRVEYAGMPIDIPRVQTRALLFRLATDLQPVSREQLAFLFWPDEPDARARRNLSQRLSLLCRTLPEPDLILLSKDHVQFDTHRVWADTTAFDHSEGGAAKPRAIDDVQNAVKLYGGVFLDGFSSLRNSEFETWVEERRRHFERSYLNLLQTLVDAHGAFVTTADAIVAAQRYLAVDDLDEVMHRRLIELYVINGDHNAASRQYEHCVSVLRNELGVEPLPETQAIQHTLASGHAWELQNGIERHDWHTHRGLSLPLVGREHAIAELQQAYRAARIGQGQLVLISGEAGIGKTRLMQDFAQLLHEPEALVLVGSSLRTTEMTPYQLIVEALRTHLQQRSAPKSDGAREMIFDERFPSGIAAMWLVEASRLMPDIHNLVSNLQTPDATIGREVIRVRLIEALHKLLISLASPMQTTVLFLDDLQWADRASLSWLVYVLGKIRHQRLLIISSFRSDEVNRLASFLSDLARYPVKTELELSGWDEAGVRNVLRQMTGHRSDESQVEALARRLHLITRGNPFFVLAILKELIESGQLARDWTTESDFPLPESVKMVVQRRIRRLAPLSRQLLEAAAVLGFRFDFDLAFRTSGGDEMATAEGLEELVSRQFVDASGDGFQFHHDLIREVVYKGLDEWRRRLFHRRAAASLEMLHAQDLDGVSAQLAFHFEGADQPEQAARYYQRAAEAALRIHAVFESINLLRRGLALIDALPAGEDRDRLELKMQLDLGLALIMAEEPVMPEVRYAYEQAELLATRLGDKQARYLALDGLHDYFHSTSLRIEGGGVIEQLLELSPTLEDPLAYARTIWRSAVEKYNLGELESAHLAIERTREWARDHSAATTYHHHAFTKWEPMISMIHGTILWLLGYSDQARSELSDAILGCGSQNAYAALLASVTCARINMEQVDVEQVMTRLREIDQIENLYGLPYARSYRQFIEGWLEVNQGQSKSGITKMGQATDALKRLNRMRDFLFYKCLLVQACLQAGRNEEGLAQVDESLALVEKLIQRPAGTELLRLKGELVTASGADSNEVEGYYVSAMEKARSQHARFFELKAIMSLNRLWLARGNEQQQHEGYHLLTTAYSWFTEGFDLQDLKQAKAMLTMYEERSRKAEE